MNNFLITNDKSHIFEKKIIKNHKMSFFTSKLRTIFPLSNGNRGQAYRVGVAG